MTTAKTSNRKSAGGSVTGKKVAKKEAPAKKFEMKLGAFPGGQVKAYKLAEGSTIVDAFKASGYESKVDASSDVRLNGQRVSSFDIALNEGDQVLIFTKVRGN